MSTGLLTYITNGIQDFVKSCIKRCVHLDLRPDTMLFGGLQPAYSDLRSSFRFKSDIFISVGKLNCWIPRWIH